MSRVSMLRRDKVQQQFAAKFYVKVVLATIMLTSLASLTSLP